MNTGDIVFSPQKIIIISFKDTCEALVNIFKELYDFNPKFLLQIEKELNISLSTLRKVLIGQRQSLTPSMLNQFVNLILKMQLEKRKIVVTETALLNIIKSAKDEYMQNLKNRTGAYALDCTSTVESLEMHIKNYYFRYKNHHSHHFEDDVPPHFSIDTNTHQTILSSKLHEEDQNYINNNLKEKNEANIRILNKFQFGLLIVIITVSILTLVNYFAMNGFTLAPLIDQSNRLGLILMLLILIFPFLYWGVIKFSQQDK